MTIKFNSLNIKKYLFLVYLFSYDIELIIKELD